jgi:hypothetical protein
MYPGYAMAFYVYVLVNEDGDTYVGQTADLIFFNLESGLKTPAPRQEADTDCVDLARARSCEVEWHPQVLLTYWRSYSKPFISARADNRVL